MASAQLPEELRVVMVGKTGKGKSTLGNSFLGKKGFFAYSASGKSLTSQCSYGERVLDNGTPLCVVDTPGMFDTTVTTSKTQEEIGKCVGLSSPGPHVFVFVHRIGRYTKEELDTITCLMEIFGHDVINYVVIVFTGKDDLVDAEMTVHDYVKDVPKELSDLIDQCKGRYAAINNRASPADVQQDIDVIVSLIGRTVRENGGNCYTGEMFQMAEACLAEKMEKKKEAGLSEAKARSEVRNEVSAGNYIQEFRRFIGNFFNFFQTKRRE